MNPPQRYLDTLASLGQLAVPFGCGGLELFEAKGLPQEQVGYSRTSNGTNLCDGRPGSWQESWLVIGQETGLGDPIILDQSDLALPVLTAIHGEGTWEPYQICSSLEAFTTAFEAFRAIAAQRGSPLARDSSPVTASERASFVELLEGRDGRFCNKDFWDSLLEL